MHLIILLILFVILGYLLAGSRPVKTVEQTSSGFGHQVKGWFAGLFGKQPLSFRQWALDPASNYFTKDFRHWLSGLTPKEADAFEISLTRHLQQAEGELAGVRLEQVKAGEFADNPAFMSIFVEAVTVYSREYRKANQAQSESSKPEQQPQKQAAPVIEEKAVAEKQPSRRRSSQAAAGD